MSVSSPSRAITIFISYATTSRADTDAFNKLLKHLSLLFSHYPTLQCYNSRLDEKSPTIQLIESHLNQADLIILLTSKDFFASQQREMQRALEFKDLRRAHIIPVQLFPTDWDCSPLRQYRSLPSDGRPISRWTDKDDAFVDVVQGIRKVVDELASQESIPRQSPSQAVLLYDPPDPYDNLFTNREQLLETISSFFASEHGGRTAILALSGLGGVGKTSIAKEYCDTSSDLYQDILWLNASSRTMLSTYVNILSDHLAVPSAVRENERQFFAAVKQWLRDRPHWLLVLDQIEDMSLIDLIVPRLSSGHVLLTMRMPNTRKGILDLPVSSMDINAGALFLLRRLQILQAQASLKQAPEEIVHQAKELVRALDGFPLALEQAGAFLKEKGGSLADYLKLYKEQRAYLLSERGQATDNQRTSVMEILASMLEALQNPLHLDLLYLLAFLHPDVIIEGQLVKGGRELYEPLRSLVTNHLTLHEALGQLHRYCLIRYCADGTVLQLQRIVQDVLIERLPKEQRRYWARQAVCLINRTFPEVRFDTMAICERYLPQAENCAALITNFHLSSKEGAQLLERLGSFCAQRASYDDAEKYLKQALYLYEHHRRTDVLNIAQTLNSLGLLYRQQARYKEAQTIHQRARELRERTLGPDHPKTMESLHNLTMIYGDLGKYQEAKHNYLHVLAIEERTKGPVHPDVADTLNELGLTYFQQGRFAQAESAYRRALAIYELSRPASHPDLTYPLDGLGTLAEREGDYQQAAILYQRAFAICQQAFGEIHPETAHSKNKLAGLATSQGDYQRAESFYQQALTVCEQTLGSGHPDVALILNDQAFLATRQKQYQSAELLYQRALSIYEVALGSEHPAVASVLHNLGQLFCRTGDKERAEKLLRRALAIREKVLDATHPSIAQSLANLANLLADQHRDTEAESLFQQAFTLYLHIPAPRHPDVAQMPEKYASLLERLNRSEEATTVRQKVRAQKEPTPTEPPQHDY
ncbi:FxSxx-COOH system tetratricopeptide repeat protein [Ktedonosporobacter rubrisoli]|nr:FxSxx-COOH system tetratricopeptide repeat protein [Ktedonosporobacter rubrisoli]